MFFFKCWQWIVTIISRPFLDFSERKIYFRFECLAYLIKKALSLSQINLIDNIAVSTFKILL